MISADDLKLKHTFTARYNGRDYTCLAKVADGATQDLYLAMPAANVTGVMPIVIAVPKQQSGKRKAESGTSVQKPAPSADAATSGSPAGEDAKKTAKKKTAKKKAAKKKTTGK